MELVQKMLEGDNLSLGRLINLVENGGDEAVQIMKLVHPYTGKAYRVGITGPPGAGKSTLVSKLIGIYRSHGLKVGILAVDPTSPFSGGSILGDRIRMQQHYLDKGVFIRSMATRGNLGGLPKTVGEVLNVLDASGKDVLLIETVGVGQTELDIINNSDTVVVVLAPGYGDNIQTMKAGLLEIADIFVINKADQPGAEEIAGDIKNMLQLRTDKAAWDIPVIAAQAINNIGIEELFSKIQAHHAVLNDGGLLRQRRQKQRWERFMQIIEQNLFSELVNVMAHDVELTNYVSEVEEGRIDPYTAAEKVLRSDKLLTNLTRCFLKKESH